MKLDSGFLVLSIKFSSWIFFSQAYLVFRFIYYIGTDTFFFFFVRLLFISWICTDGRIRSDFQTLWTRSHWIFFSMYMRWHARQLQFSSIDTILLMKYWNIEACKSGYQRQRTEAMIFYTLIYFFSDFILLSVNQCLLNYVKLNFTGPVHWSWLW